MRCSSHTKVSCSLCFVDSEQPPSLGYKEGKGVGRGGLHNVVIEAGDEADTQQHIYENNSHRATLLEFYHMNYPTSHKYLSVCGCVVGDLPINFD